MKSESCGSNGKVDEKKLLSVHPTGPPCSRNQARWRGTSHGPCPVALVVLVCDINELVRTQPPRGGKTRAKAMKV